MLTFKIACSGNMLSELDISKHFELIILDCSRNQLTELDLTSNNMLVQLHCGNNQFRILDLVAQRDLGHGGMYGGDMTIVFGLGEGTLRINSMPSLETVCLHSNMVFDSITTEDRSSWHGDNVRCYWNITYNRDSGSVCIDYSGSPKIEFTKDCPDYEPPILSAIAFNIPEYIEAVSSEDGMIYLVSKEIRDNLDTLKVFQLDSVDVVNNEAVIIQTSAFGNGTYWLYAVDNTGNISDPIKIYITGVGLKTYIDEKLRIYPIPAKSIVNVEVNTPDPYDVLVTNINRQLLFRKTMDTQCSNIDLSSYQSGVYFITIRSTDFVTTRKIIKL